MALIQYCFETFSTLFDAKFDGMPTTTYILMKGAANLITGTVFYLPSAAFAVLPYLILTTKVWTLCKLIFLSWCILEILFYFHIQRLIPIISERQIPTEFKQSEKLFYANKFIEHGGDVTLLLQKWLVSQPNHKKVHFGHFVDWIIWAFFDKSYNELTTEELPNAEEILNLFRSKVECLEPSEMTDFCQVPSIRPFMDPLQIIHKPLLFYAGVGIPKTVGHIGLLALGFRRLQTNSLIYWTNSSQVKCSLAPIFFVHGVGIGYFMYFKNVYDLVQMYPKRQIFLIEIPAISVSPFAKAATMEQTLTAVDKIFKSNQLRGCSWVGHSFGTVVVSWFIKNRPQYVSQVTLIDPICFRLWDSSLVVGFLYTPPQSLAHQLAQNFLVKDAMIAHSMCRHFWWHKNILFLDEIKVNSKIYLSQRDFIIDAQVTYDYLQSQLDINPQPNIHIEMLDIPHGGYLVNNRYSHHILSQV